MEKEHFHSQSEPNENQCETTVETMKLQIGFSVREILDFYRDDLTFMAEYKSFYPPTLLNNERTTALDNIDMTLKSTNTEVEAVIVDRHENFDWDKWLDEKDYKPVDNSLLHADALNLIKEQHAIPATLWPLLCFGYQHREYFKKLKNNPKWLIAPDALRTRTSYLHRICYDNFGNGELPQVLKTLIDYFGPGRVRDLRRELLKRGSTILDSSEPIIIPQELTIDAVDAFAEQVQLNKEPIEAATVIDPAAVDTEHRGAVILDYGEPKYPRVLAIRSK